MGGAILNASVTVVPSVGAVTLTAAAVSPAAVASGASATLTLTLSGPAPAGGASVEVESHDLTAFPAPSACLIPAGQSSAGFPIQAGVIPVTTTVQVEAEYGGGSQEAAVTVTASPSAVTLSSMGIGPATVASGDAATLTLTLNAAAPAGGATVSVASGDAVAFPAQSGYLVPEGQTGASFSVSAGSVAAPTLVPVGSSFGGVSQVAMVTVTPAPSNSAAPAGLASISISPTSLVFGATATVTLTLSQPAPTGGALVNLSTGDAVSFPVPSTYLVPAGETGASFSVTSGAGTVAATVTVGGAYANTSQTAMVTVAPSAQSLVTLSSMTISPATVASGGTATIELTLSGPAPAEGALVGVASGNASAFPALSAYLVPAGQTGASFSVTAGSVSIATPAPVSACYGGVSQVALASVIPGAAPATGLAAVSVTPAALTSGDTATLVLTLNGMAPTGGALVAVSSGDSVAFPAQAAYPIPAGQSSASFPVTAGTVTALTTVTVGAVYLGAAQTVSVQIAPPAAQLSLKSLAVSPAAVVSGNTATLTFTLSGPAPAGGVSIGASSGGSTAFPVEPLYSIPGGTKQRQFRSAGWPGSGFYQRGRQCRLRRSEPSGDGNRNSGALLFGS